MLHGKTDFRIPIQTRFVDIEDLNRLCFKGDQVDICKVSFHAYLYLRDQYQLLNAGSALGHGCGPLVIAKRPMDREALKRATIAIPGQYTTAALLLKLWLGPQLNLQVMRFDKIMPAVATGRADAGLIIHESRFTYESHGLMSLIDLGDWWEETTGCAIPLGGIVARRSLEPELIRTFDHCLAESIDYAWEHGEEVNEFMTKHAQEMEPSVMRQHVALYVNERTRDLGAEGHAAIDTLFHKARERGLLKS